MDNLKVLFVASEVAPFAKTGGLADVVGVLPKVLKQEGVDARVVMPLYKQVRDKFGDKLEFMRWSMIRMGWRSLYSGLFHYVHDGVDFYFIDNEYYFAYSEIYKEYAFDIERFCFFQRAVLEIIGEPMHFYPDIIHCNDWQAGLIPCLLQAHYHPYGYLTNVKTVFTIHNLRFQGVHGYEQIADYTDLSQNYLNDYAVLKDGVPNMVKAGIVFADKVTTVSPTYANEIMTAYYGEGLDGVLRSFAYKVTGIVNGIDVDLFNPASDACISEHYSISDYIIGKAANKKALQQELGLPENAQVPLLGMITRLTDQKGMDLFNYIAEELLQKSECQVVVLGTGEARYEEALRYFASRYPDKFKACIYFDPKLSNRIYAASDLFLMPSLFEPCGLSQLIAMRYGSVPIVRETGGLKDTVVPYNQFEHSGTGFTFSNINAHEFLHAIGRALELYYANKRGETTDFDMLIRNGMSTDLSWTKSAQAYLALYKEIV